MIKAIIFDMDGVIINSEKLWWKAIDEQMEKHGIQIDHSPALKKFINIHIRGRSQKYAITMAKKRFGLKGSYEQLLNERLNILIRIFKQELKSIFGSISLIRFLHQNRYPLAIASSSPRKIINFVIKQFKLKSYFKIIVSGDDFKKSKPHPEIFLKCARLFKEKPSNILVIEDSISGIQAARRAKMKCIALKQPYTSYKYLKTADLVVNKLGKITVKVIKNL